MTINIDIYCKRKPSIDDLVRNLHFELANPVKNYDSYLWIPKGTTNRILVCLKQYSETVTKVYDKEIIDESINLARFAGIEVPEELLKKFIRDRKTVQKINIITGNSIGLEELSKSLQSIESYKHQNNLEYISKTTLKEQSDLNNETQKIKQPSTDEEIEEMYAIAADNELYEFAIKYPLLEGLDPSFRLPFGLAKFTKGEPTWEIGLEATVTASKDSLKYMTQLAEYLSKEFEGIIFDEDNERFGIPDYEKLHSQGMDLFLTVAKDLNSQGGKITPRDF